MPLKNEPKTTGQTNKNRFKRGGKRGPGRPPGARDKTTTMLEKMMADDGKAVVEPEPMPIAGEMDPGHPLTGIPG